MEEHRGIGSTQLVSHSGGISILRTTTSDSQCTSTLQNLPWPDAYFHHNENKQKISNAKKTTNNIGLAKTAQATKRKLAGIHPCDGIFNHVMLLIPT